MTLPASGPISLGQIADEFGVSRQAAFPSAFYGKGGAPSSGPLSFADFYGRSAALTVTASPTSVNGSGTGTVTSGSTTASASGGAAPYSYSWTKVSGDAIAPNSPSNATTSFSGSVPAGATLSATFRVTATDSSGSATGSATVNVMLSSTS